MTWMTVLALAAALGCDGGPTQPSGKALVDAQNASQKAAEDDELQQQADSKKATGGKRR